MLVSPGSPFLLLVRAAVAAGPGAANQEAEAQQWVAQTAWENPPDLGIWKL